MTLARVEAVKSTSTATEKDKRYKSMKIVTQIVFLLIMSWAAAIGQTIEEDPAVTQMMERFVEFNKAHQTVRGWRVQILVTTDRRQMEATRKEFQATYPDYTIHYQHENPFYHLKSGAFLTQASARPFLRLMQEKYSSAFVVSEEIDLEEVLIYQQ